MFNRKNYSAFDVLKITTLTMLAGLPVSLAARKAQPLYLLMLAYQRL